MRLRQMAGTVLAAATFWAAPQAEAEDADGASFAGTLYYGYYVAADDCEIWEVEDGKKSTAGWREEFVEVDGRKEPAAFGRLEVIYPVNVAAGATVSASVVHGTTTAAHVKSVSVLSDAQMYARYRRSEDQDEVRSLWPYGGTRATRAWVVVALNNVTAGAAHEFDLARCPTVNAADGSLSGVSVTDFAKRYGATLSGTRAATVSAWFTVAINGSGERFPQRVWNVCDPFDVNGKDGRAFGRIEDRGGNTDLVYSPGLWLVTPDMIAAGGGDAGGGSTETPGGWSDAWKKARTLKGVATRALPPPRNVQGVFELKCGKANKQGVAKVSATLTGLDGKRKSYRAQSVSVSGEKATADFGTLSVTIDGESFAGGEGLPGGLSVTSADVGGGWAGASATVTVEADDLSMFPGTVLEDFLPAGETASAPGGRWKFAKAASVKWAKPKKGAALPELYDAASGKGLVVDTSRDKTNLSGLKLTYAPKTGTFKGTFKVYALEGEGRAAKLRKYSAKASGVVVGGVGYGEASVKRPAAGPWAVSVR